ncbi:MAG: fatty-acid--CoA ligase [Frankiales bacterium]|nr:fatty-acid--CoA ligase [Frankiales bacterium]
MVGPKYVRRLRAAGLPHDRTLRPALRARPHPPEETRSDMTTTTVTEAPAPEVRYSSELVAQFRGDGYWRDESLTQWVKHWADRKPDAVVVTDGDASLSWAELRDQSARFAKALKGLGVVAGDRVQVQLPNWAEFTVVYAGIARIGAVLVPTMPIYRSDEVRYVFQHSAAKVSVVPTTYKGFDHAGMVGALRDEVETLTGIVTVRGRAEGALCFEDVITGPVPSDDELGPVPSADAPHAIMYTSGTESRPKGCTHTFNTMSFTMYGLGQDILGYGPDSVVFMPSPVTHATGLAMGVASPIVAGSAIHLMPAWEAKDGLRRIQEFGCTHTMTATPFVRMALDALTPEDDLSKLEVWASAGAPIPASLLTEFQSALSTTVLLPVYGSSEGLLATACRLDDPADKVLTSDGRPNPGVVMELRAEDGSVVRAGQAGEGEICFGGPGLMLGYWNDPDKTRAAIDEQGLLSTGDVGRFDEDGFMRVTGRIKDIIIRGGTNISAREVEDNLLAHDRVAAVAVVPVPDERLGEIGCAFVVPKGEPPTLEELCTFLRDDRKIAIQKLPEMLRIVDSLPMTATGKVQKFVLKTQLATS